MYESLDALRELVDADPNNPELLLLYGRVLIQTGQPGLAEWPLRKAMADPEWFERAAMQVANVEISGGNADNAMELYAEVLKANPDNMVARLARANTAARSPRHLEEALAEVDRILEIDPEQIGAFKPRIVAYLGMAMPEEANKALEELGARIKMQEDENDPIRGWHCATMAIFADEQGDEALARERWASCEEEFPTHSNVVSQSIDFHKAHGELERAIEIAEAAYAADPGVDSGYRLVLADLLRQAERPEAAEKLLLEAIDTGNPLGRPSALLALTEHYKAVGDLKAAAVTLEQALLLTQKSMGPQPDLVFSLAELFILTGDDERALELTRQMTESSRRTLIQARVAHDRKQYAQAIQLYEETSRLWPENPYAPYHAARAAMSVAQFDRAFASYLLSIRVEDGATDARLRAGRLLNAQGEYGTAIEMLAGGRAGTTTDCLLLIIEIVGRTQGREAAVGRAGQMSEKYPAFFGRAIASAAKGTRQRQNGAQAAWKIIEPLLANEFTPPNQLAIVAAAVEFAPGEKQLALVAPLVAAIVQAFPDAADSREIEGMFFERSGAPDKAASRYREALEVEPDRPGTLLHLARVTGSTDPQGATKSIKRALNLLATSEEYFDSTLLISAVEALSDSSGNRTLLEMALEVAPSDGPLAFRVASLLETQGGETERVEKLAERAVRFQAGPEAVALRDRVRGQS